jgi:hypothetical protein
MDSRKLVYVRCDKMNVNGIACCVTSVEVVGRVLHIVVHRGAHAVPI